MPTAELQPHTAQGACDQPGSGDVLLEHGGADTVLRFAVLVLSRHVIGLLRRGQRGAEGSESGGRSYSL